jgi:hypothetical protein
MIRPLTGFIPAFALLLATVAFSVAQRGDEKGKEKAGESASRPPNPVPAAIRIPTDCKKIYTITFSPVEKVAIVAGIGDLCLVDVRKGECRSRLRGQDNWITCVRFSPDGRLVAASTYLDREVTIWESDTAKTLTTYGRAPLGLRKEKVDDEEFEGGISIAFSSDGKYLFHAAQNLPVRLLNIESGKDIREFGEPGEGDRILAVSPRGNLLATGGFGRDVRVWDVETGKTALAFPAHEKRVRALAFSPVVNTLATSGNDAHVRITDLVSGETVQDLPSDDRVYTSLAYSADGKLLLLGNSDYVRLVEVDSGKDVHGFAVPDEQLTSLTLSPDGSVIVAGCLAGNALIWDLGGTLKDAKDKARLTRDELCAMWSDFANADPAIAYPAVWSAVREPEHSLPFLQKHLSPTPPLDPALVAQLIADLDNSDFETREKAMVQLGAYQDRIESALRQVLREGRPSPEARRRIERLLDRLKPLPPDVLRGLRAVRALEQIGTKEAIQLLTALSQGSGEARVTLEAKAALRRMNKASQAPTAPSP